MRVRVPSPAPVHRVQRHPESPTRVCVGALVALEPAYSKHASNCSTRRVHQPDTTNRALRGAGAVAPETTRTPVSGIRTTHCSTGRTHDHQDGHARRLTGRPSRSSLEGAGCVGGRLHIFIRRRLAESVGGSGEVPKRPNGADCKSAGTYLRRFESSPLHQPRLASDAPGGGSGPGVGGSRVARAREGSRKTVRRIDSPTHPVRAPAGIAQLARAQAFQAWGRGFESRFPLQLHATRTQQDTKIQGITGPRSSGGRARPW